MNRSFRPLVSNDLEAALLVDKLASQSPWSLSQFSDSAIHNSCTVVCVGEQVVGFTVFQQVLDEVSLLNIAIDPCYQGHGHAKALLEYELRCWALQRICQCFLEVRVSNERAIGLYGTLGFTVVGERKNYYPVINAREQNDRENALLMRLLLEDFTEGQS